MTAQAVAKWQKNKYEEPSWSDREKNTEREPERKIERETKIRVRHVNAVTNECLVKLDYHYHTH